MLGAGAEEAIRQYANGEISLGRAAELAGMNYVRFEQVLRQREVKPLGSRPVDSADTASQRELADAILG